MVKYGHDIEIGLGGVGPGCIVPGERTLVNVDRGGWMILQLSLNAVGDKISLPLPGIKLGLLICTISNVLTKSRVRCKEL